MALQLSPVYTQVVTRLVSNQAVNTRELMVEIFKTNVQEVRASTLLIQKILNHCQANAVSFDLEDCDKVLRIEGRNFLPDDIIRLVASCGFQCEVLM